MKGDSMSDMIYRPRQYQDELDRGEEDTDPIMEEENEDITDTLHVDPVEFKERIEENENSDSEQSEDTREEVEDLDQET